MSLVIWREVWAGAYELRVTYTYRWTQNVIVLIHSLRKGYKITRSYWGEPWSSVSSVTQSFWLFVTPWTTAAFQASLSITDSQSLLKLMSIKSVMPFNYFILCHPLLPLPSVFPSIRIFSNESVLPIKWPKYWSFSISLSNEYSGLFSFRIDWFDLAISSNTTVQNHQFYSAQLSLWSNSHIYTWLLEKPQLWLDRHLLTK